MTVRSNVRRYGRRLALPLVVSLAADAVLHAQSAAPIHPTSRVWISGASNIRRFQCRATLVQGALALRATPTPTAVVSGENASSEPSLRIVVSRLDCGIGAMNRHLREALHETSYPTVEFRLAAYDVDFATASPTAHLTGTLRIAGVDRRIDVRARVQADSLGTLHVLGSTVLPLREFGIAPPRRFGGLLRVRDTVTVHFDVLPGTDGGAVDHIRCSLAPSTRTDAESGASDVAYF